MAISKESILQFKSKPTVTVNVPEWGGVVHVRVMSGTERDDYEDETFRLNGSDVSLNRKNARARLLVRCIADEAGQRIFSDEDADALGGQPANIIDKVYAEALKVNGFTKQDVEELVKN